MRPHSIFYYPYATVGPQQSLLLKAAALYFYKLYILDPAKATFAHIGSGDIEPEVRLLEQEKILERIAPEEVLLAHQNAISAAIRQDLAEPEFLKLCSEKGDATWTLVLAKVPKAIREDARFRPLDDAMRHVLTGYAEVYDEYAESPGGAVEYRYADYPFAVGAAIMLNHSLVAGLLHGDAIPISDDPLHSRILNYKLQRALQIPEIKAVLQSLQAQQRFAQTKLATQALTDIQLAVTPEALPMEKIIGFREKYATEREAAREKLSWMAREITSQPWTDAFEKHVHHTVIPALRKGLASANASWEAWLKVAGFALSGAAAVLGVFSNPVTTVALAATSLTLAKDVGIDGLEWLQKWKSGETRNGLHYLIRLSRS